MPSANWREVADNWFGACCCSFGGASEKMVHEYVKAYSCSEVTCLLDGPSVTICKDDLDGSVFPECSGEQVDCSNMFDVVATAREGNPNSREFVGYLPQNDWRLNEINGTVVAERKLDTNKSSDALIGSPVHRVFSKESVLCCVDQTSNLLNHAHGRTPDVSDRFSRMLPSMGNLTSHTSQNWLCNGSLGNGFLIKTSNLSNDVQWVEFLCRQCSSLLGSYPVHGINGPIDGGIRLFKCYISTSMDVGGPHNVFRQHTMQRVFVNLLLESATDELSFCTIVRDLRTKFPMVQIILLNSKAWCAKGDCLENDTSRCLFEVNLQPVVKVLFSDCNIETGVNSRAMEQWTTKRNADEVYMMAHQTKELMEFLKLAHESLPPSYSSFQGMSLSYIER
uniref:Elongation factor Tu n=2 Tax=Anthurium amnicola TaxID=1678845 RepID=A0A1D1Z0T0_9ARAE